MEKQRITIIGAGYMGSAMVFPLSKKGFEVSLWGTWLDDAIIGQSRKGAHPKLKKRLPAAVRTYMHEALEQAVHGSDILFLAVSSEGFIPVFQRILDVLDDRDIFFFCLTKGLLEQDGKILRVSEAADGLYRERFQKGIRHWSSIGGPVKALELSDGIPTLSVYSAVTQEVFRLADSFSAPYYRILQTDDLAGLEVSSALKNLYAAAMGVIDGIYGQDPGQPYHNFSSWVFAQSLKEIGEIARAFGARKDTVSGFAGAGDLYVTARSGRNKRFGELIGKGLTATAAHAKMAEMGETAEGFHVLCCMQRWITSPGGRQFRDADLPLLKAMRDIAFHDGSPKDCLCSVLDKIQP